MANIVGVGAIMIYARDPAALSGWYERHLGIHTELDASDGCYYGEIRHAPSGTFAHFGIYPEGSTPRRPGALMVNYQVDDLDRFTERLRRDGVTIERTLDEPYGRFAYLDDPEGNPIELWAGELPADPRACSGPKG
jgi:catechol 2,3-dioxygenase-like lactoylglutathione lyase family enzyme